MSPTHMQIKKGGGGVQTGWDKKDIFFRFWSFGCLSDKIGILSFSLFLISVCHRFFSLFLFSRFIYLFLFTLSFFLTLFFISSISFWFKSMKRIKESEKKERVYFYFVLQNTNIFQLGLILYSSIIYSIWLEAFIICTTFFLSLLISHVNSYSFLSWMIGIKLRKRKMRLFVINQII